MEYNSENVNTVDEGNGYYPIHGIVTTYGAKIADLKKVIKLGADIEAKNRRGRTALHLACLDGQHNMVRTLIAQGANVDAVDDESYTPIFMAVQSSNASINKLAEAGANINHSRINGSTPLMYACEIAKVGAIKNLCDLGANANVAEFSSKSLVRIALESFEETFPSNALQMVRSLIKAGDKVGGKDIETGQTELHLAVSLSKTPYVSEKIYYELIKLLINSGCNPWGADSKGRSALLEMNEQYFDLLKPCFKKFIKKNEISIATKISSVIELKAFYFNQTKLSKSEVYDLLPLGSEAKKSFEETLKLPSLILEL